MRLAQHLTALAALGLTLVSARAALAACTSNADCGPGFACEDVSSDGSCVAGPCSPDGTCPAPVCTPPVPEMACVPAPCDTGAACPSDMVCYAFTDDCADPPPCVLPEGCPEQTCTPSVDQRCVPGWVPPLLSPCNTDADCGTGFRCTGPTVDCECSGFAPTPPAAGGSSGDPVPATGGTDGGCTCQADPTDPKYCELTIQPCTTSDTCAPGWTCEDNPMESDCSVAPPVPGLGGSGGATAVPPCPPPDPARICLPPHALEVIEADLGSYDSSGQVVTESGVAGGASIPPATGSGGSGPTSGPSAPATSSGGHAESDPADAPSSSGDHGGCQMAAGAAGSGGPLAGLLLALTLVGARRRRRG